MFLNVRIDLYAMLHWQYIYLMLILNCLCKVNVFLSHKRKICLIFTVYDADSNKMMQIKCLSTYTLP